MRFVQSFLNYLMVSCIKSLLWTRQASSYYLLLQNLVDYLSVTSSLIICLHRLILFLPAEFFKLMNEVENEDLVFTLETIVDKFGEEMAPYALGLCQNLVWCTFISWNGLLLVKLFLLELSFLALFSGSCILEVYEHC